MRIQRRRGSVEHVFVWSLKELVEMTAIMLEIYLYTGKYNTRTEVIFAAFKF